MPDELEIVYNSRLGLLRHIANALEVETKEYLELLDDPLKIAYAVISLSLFRDKSNALLTSNVRCNPCIDVEDQITGEIRVRNEVSLGHCEKIVENKFSAIASTLLDDPENTRPLRRLVCLIPPQAKPTGFDQSSELPRTFVLILRLDTNMAESLQTPEVIPIKTPYFALVMKGGGIKGLAYVGALEVLSKHYNFNWFVGTSAGAATAILLAAGYTPEQLKKIMVEKNFKDFYDAPWYKLVTNFIFYRGLYRAKTFSNWIDRLLAAKLHSPTKVKLSELLPNRVTVYASRKEKRALKFDSIENDVDAAHAARCSMSIPFVFIPESDQGFRTYDGGIQHNYPLEQLLQDHPKVSFISLYLGSELYEPPTSGWILADLLSIWTEPVDAEMLKKHRANTVVIDTRPIGTLDFSLTLDEKEFLLSCGRAAAYSHFDPNSSQTLEARKVRDELRLNVENARKVKKRRRCFKRLIAICVIAFLIYWFWPNQGQTEPAVNPSLQRTPPRPGWVDSAVVNFSIDGLTTKLPPDSIPYRVPTKISISNMPLTALIISNSHPNRGKITSIVPHSVTYVGELEGEDYFELTVKSDNGEVKIPVEFTVRKPFSQDGDQK